MFPNFQPATLDDKKISFADLRGKYVLIDFWATWCGPCIAEMKHIQRLHDQYANDPRLVIVGISVDDRADEPTQFLRTRKLPWRQAFAGASVWNTLSLRAIPSVWLIGPDGKILARQIPEEQLDQTIEKALGHGK
jgi:thiol-disulfide isomerase/thioredoxin